MHTGTVDISVHQHTVCQMLISQSGNLIISHKNKEILP